MSEDANSKKESAHELLVKPILKTAADKCAPWLNDFIPWNGTKGGIPEQNLSFLFAHAFLQHHPSGRVFLEAAFDNYGKEGRFDAYLFTEEFAIVLECKQDIWGNEKLCEIASDIARMKPEGIKQMQKRHLSATPEKTVRMILANAWDDENEGKGKWWIGNSPDHNKWKRDGLDSRWQYGYLKIYDYPAKEVTKESDRRLLWLYAIAPDLEQTGCLNENH